VRVKKQGKGKGQGGCCQLRVRGEETPPSSVVGCIEKKTPARFYLVRGAVGGEESGEKEQHVTQIVRGGSEISKTSSTRGRKLPPRGKKGRWVKEDEILERGKKGASVFFVKKKKDEGGNGRD